MLDLESGVSGHRQAPAVADGERSWHGAGFVGATWMKQPLAGRFPFSRIVLFFAGG